MEPIAIVGIGCRFPKAKNPESFWQLLRNGENAITEVPKERWDINDFYDPDPKTPGKISTRWGGFLEEVDKFDAEFFGISSDELEHTDPQQRLFLEVAWEALESAGIVPTSLAGSQTGIFFGLCTIDYHRLLYKNFSQIGPYSGIGTTPCITANRLSYLLDLHGPSMSIDTACSSSLVTVHLACQSLRSGESDLCLAGGVNLILSPDSTISSSQTCLLSATGSCKSFDANADGYVRGEGCGVIILKRLSDAIRDADNILALIKGSAVNQDGLSNSLSAPNGVAQQRVIRKALENAKVQPHEISYVDAHAVGTSIGDAIEFKALKTVLMEGRPLDKTCWIGSVKPNIGHLEAAGGISALIKIVLSLQHEEIPPHLNLEQLNSYISIENTPFSIPTEATKWTRGNGRRLAGVSAFGFGGTNAHIILEEAPASNQCPNIQEQGIVDNDRSVHLLTLSAKTDTALLDMTQKYEDFLASNPQVSLTDVCFTANTGRAHFDYRLGLITESVEQLQQQLSSFRNQKQTAGLTSAKVKGRKRPKVAFLFPGEGLEYFACGRQLYQSQPIFRQAIQCCADYLEPYLEVPLTETLQSKVVFTDLLSKSKSSELILFAIEYALFKLWQSWGITPKVVMGYGIGEYVAATVAGVFGLEDALNLIVQRTNLLHCLGQVGIADFAQVAKEVIYSQPQISIISSQTGEQTTKEIATPEYWLSHLEYTSKHLSPFNGDIKALVGECLLLVIGSKPTCIPEEVECLTCLRAGQDDLRSLFHSLAELFIRGTVIDWAAFESYAPHRLLQLPTYPFQRQRYWFKTVEHGHKEPAQVQHKTQTQFFNLLHQIEAHNITQLLRNKDGLSEAQMKLLPELLELALQYRQHENEISNDIKGKKDKR